MPDAMFVRSVPPDCVCYAPPDMYVFVAVFCQGSDRLAVASLKHHATEEAADRDAAEDARVEALVPGRQPRTSSDP